MFKISLDFLHDLFHELNYRYGEHQITALSAQLAYFMLLSLFPFLIFLFSIFAKFSLSTDIIINALENSLPEDSVIMIVDYLQSMVLIDNSRYLTIAAIATLYAASKGVEAITRALNVAYRVEENPSFIKQKFFGMLYTVSFMIILLILTILPILGREFLSLLSLVFPMSLEFIEEVVFIKWVSTFVVIIIAVTMIFLVLPNKKLKFSEIWQGALFTIVSWSLMSYGFSYFVSNFGRYSIIYGSLAAVIILMLWLYFTGLVIIIGAELNSIVIDGYIAKRAIKKLAKKRK